MCRGVGHPKEKKKKSIKTQRWKNVMTTSDSKVMGLPAKTNKTGKCMTTAEKCLDTTEDNTHTP